MAAKINFSDVLNKTKIMVEDNLTRSDFTDDQKKAIMEYVGPVLWFTLQHQGLELIDARDKHKLDKLVQSLKDVL